MELISMTAFVIKSHNTIEDVADSESAMYNYANFLEQPLTLGMLVPCDEDGNVLEEPKFWREKYNDDIPKNEFDLCTKYHEAKEKVLFEGFSIESEKFFGVCFYDVVRNKDTYVFVKDKDWEKLNDYNTIENLVLYNLPLTLNAIKQFEL